MTLKETVEHRSSGDTPAAIERDVLGNWAEHVVSYDAQDLPADVAHVTKLSILDTIGVMIAATSLSPLVTPVVDFATEAGGKEQSTVAVFGQKIPVHLAAFTNGAMAHCLDYDDLTYDIAQHPSSSTVPVAIAMAEHHGDVSGEELLAAVAIGNDLSTRMGDSIVWKSDWFTTPLFGYFSAVATASRVAGLNVDQTFNAFGIAFCQAGGTLEMRRSTGSDIAGMYGAWPNKTAAIAVDLASRGVPGIARALEGETGLYEVYFDGEYDRSALTQDLGVVFRGDRVSFKPWPSCGLTHNPIHATLDVLRRNSVASDEIAEIHVKTGNENSWALCRPLADRRHPITAMDARYSIPYTVAVAAVTGGVTLGDFTDEALEREDVATMADKVVAVFDESLRSSELIPPVLVEAETTDGRRYEQTASLSYGRDPENPMSESDIVEKFRDCANFSARPFSSDQVEQIIDSILRLETLENASLLGRLLAP